MLTSISFIVLTPSVAVIL